MERTGALGWNEMILSSPKFIIMQSLKVPGWSDRQICIRPFKGQCSIFCFPLRLYLVHLASDLDSILLQRCQRGGTDARTSLVNMPGRGVQLKMAVSVCVCV